MNNEEPIKIEPSSETFRGYIEALDRQMEAAGGIAIPFIAFAKMSGADVDKIYVKEDFENFMNATAAEYGGKIRKHSAGVPEGKSGFGI